MNDPQKWKKKIDEESSDTKTEANKILLMLKEKTSLLFEEPETVLKKHSKYHNWKGTYPTSEECSHIVRHFIQFFRIVTDFSSEKNVQQVYDDLLSAFRSFIESLSESDTVQILDKDKKRSANLRFHVELVKAVIHSFIVLYAFSFNLLHHGAKSKEGNVPSNIIHVNTIFSK